MRKSEAVDTGDGDAPRDFLSCASRACRGRPLRGAGEGPVGVRPQWQQWRNAKVWASHKQPNGGPFWTIMYICGGGLFLARSARCKRIEQGRATAAWAIVLRIASSSSRFHLSFTGDAISRDHRSVPVVAIILFNPRNHGAGTSVNMLRWAAGLVALLAVAAWGAGEGQTLAAGRARQGAGGTYVAGGAGEVQAGSFRLGSDSAVEAGAATEGAQGAPPSPAWFIRRLYLASGGQKSEAHALCSARWAAYLSGKREAAPRHCRRRIVELSNCLPHPGVLPCP